MPGPCRDPDEPILGCVHGALASRGRPTQVRAPLTAEPRSYVDTAPVASVPRGTAVLALRPVKRLLLTAASFTHTHKHTHTRPSGVAPTPWGPCHQSKALPGTGAAATQARADLQPLRPHKLGSLTLQSNARGTIASRGYEQRRGQSRLPIVYTVPPRSDHKPASAPLGVGRSEATRPSNAALLEDTAAAAILAAAPLAPRRSPPRALRTCGMYEHAHTFPPAAHTFPPAAHTFPPAAHTFPPAAHTFPPAAHTFPPAARARPRSP